MAANICANTAQEWSNRKSSFPLLDFFSLLDRPNQLSAQTHNKYKCPIHNCRPWSISKCGCEVNWSGFYWSFAMHRHKSLIWLGAKEKRRWSIRCLRLKQVLSFICSQGGGSHKNNPSSFRLINSHAARAVRSLTCWASLFLVMCETLCRECLLSRKVKSTLS